jgi:hypothetical protein
VCVNVIVSWSCGLLVCLVGILLYAVHMPSPEGFDRASPGVHVYVYVYVYVYAAFA